MNYLLVTLSGHVKRKLDDNPVAAADEGLEIMALGTSHWMVVSCILHVEIMTGRCLPVGEGEVPEVPGSVYQLILRAVGLVQKGSGIVTLGAREWRKAIMLVLEVG